MSLNQWNNHQQLRDHMENNYQEQQRIGDDPEKAREYYGGKARMGILIVVLVLLLAGSALLLGRM